MVIEKGVILELLQKRRDGEELSEFEVKKVEKFVENVNKVLGEYEEELNKLKSTIASVSKGKQTLAIQACIEYAVNAIKQQLVSAGELEACQEEIQQVDPDNDFNILHDAYLVIADEVLKQAVEKVTTKTVEA